MKVAGPVAAPGTPLPGVFAFIFSLTEFPFALYLASRNGVTLPIAIAGITPSFEGATYGEASPLSQLSLVAAIVLGVLHQRHLVRGPTRGALEG